MNSINDNEFEKMKNILKKLREIRKKLIVI